jgi:hypothetical protein
MPRKKCDGYGEKMRERRRVEAVAMWMRALLSGRGLG